MTTDAPILAAVNLHKRFGATAALTGASLAVSAGEVVAVTGPSGSGKSTLIHLIAGLHEADSGSVSFAGREHSARTAHDISELRRTRIAYIAQRGGLLGELDATMNVALPLLLAGEKRRLAVSRARAGLEAVGAADFANALPGEMSGGQTQLVATARAVAMGADLILADEPTGALDSTATDLVADMLCQQARQRHAAVLIVTHDNRVAARADREVVLFDGATQLSREEV